MPQSGYLERMHGINYGRQKTIAKFSFSVIIVDGATTAYILDLSPVL